MTHTPIGEFRGRLVRIANNFEMPRDALGQLFVDADIADELLAALQDIANKEANYADDNDALNAKIDRARAALAKVQK